MICKAPSRSNTSSRQLLPLIGWMNVRRGSGLQLWSQWTTDRGKQCERPSEPDVTIEEPKEKKPHMTIHGEESCMWNQEGTREELGKHIHNWKWIFAALSLKVKKRWWGLRVNYLYELNIISAKRATHAMRSSCSESLCKHTLIANGYFWKF